jgi:hypothetical protein
MAPGNRNLHWYTAFVRCEFGGKGLCSDLLHITNPQNLSTWIGGAPTEAIIEVPGPLRTKQHTTPRTPLFLRLLVLAKEERSLDH